MLIVIEGLDGCGKSTQLDLLKNKCENTYFITFPYYETESGKIVSNYLSGMYNEADPKISAYSASAMYAVDRYTSYKTHWETLYKSKNSLISARYVTSNAVYQMTKLPEKEWDGYLEWLFDFEYKKLGLPEPDHTIFLDMPIDISQKLMTSRYGGDDSKKDIHERNVGFLKKCRNAALYTGKKCGWEIISCSNGGEPRKIADIHNEICRNLENWGIRLTKGSNE